MAAGTRRYTHALRPCGVTNGISCVSVLVLVDLSCARQLAPMSTYCGSSGSGNDSLVIVQSNATGAAPSILDQPCSRAFKCQRNPDGTEHMHLPSYSTTDITRYHQAIESVVPSGVQPSLFPHAGVSPAYFTSSLGIFTCSTLVKATVFAYDEMAAHVKVLTKETTRALASNPCFFLFLFFFLFATIYHKHDRHASHTDHRCTSQHTLTRTHLAVRTYPQ